MRLIPDTWLGLAQTLASTLSHSLSFSRGYFKKWTTHTSEQKAFYIKNKSIQQLYILRECKVDLVLISAAWIKPPVCGVASGGWIPVFIGDELMETNEDTQTQK